jgi:putative peptidoglycan lipid II flippase
VSIISAVQPELADSWAAGDLDGFRRHLSVGIRSIAVVVVPAAVGYVLLARPIVSMLLEHGALHGASAARVAGTLALMALGLPAFSTWLFLTSAYQAMQDTRTLFFLYVVENAVNIVAAVPLHAAFGVRGLGLAFALAYASGTAAALLHLRRRIGGLDGRALGTALARIGAASAVMAVAVIAVRLATGALGSSGIGAAMRAGAATVAGVTVYVAACRIFRVGELRSLLAFRRRR